MNQVAPVAAPERDRLRSGVLVVVVVATVGIVVELATSRHWHGGIQLIPWFAAGLLLVATALIGRGAPGGVRVGRVLAAVVSLASLFGVPGDLLVEIADRTNAVIGCTIGGKSIVAEDHPRSVGSAMTFAPVASELLAADDPRAGAARTGDQDVQAGTL